MKVEIVKKVKILNLLSSKTKRVDHKSAQIIHFKRRWKERVGEFMDDVLYQKVLELVKKEGSFLYKAEKHSSGSVYKIRYNSMNIKLVYDGWNQQLITVLCF